ncbi:MAG: hypothetical protein H6730_19190 [Deltaproteobacteria bacterium]|nr:hypothetical protein [Deltaproteobacteria bacterium]
MSITALLLTAMIAQAPSGTTTATVSTRAVATSSASSAAPPPPAAPADADVPRPAPIGPVVQGKSVLVAWALSFGLGLGNWYAEAPGHAIFVLLGEAAGAAMMIAGKGPGRSAGLVTLLVSWAMDWTSALRNARLYNEAHRAQAELYPPTAPEDLADSGSDLASTRQVAIGFGF